MGRVGIARQEWTDEEGVVPAQWRDLHVADAGSPSARLYRAILLDALQVVGRFIRLAHAHEKLTPKQVRERRELVAWLQARGISAYAYRVPFQQAMAYGFPSMNADAIRAALLVALDVQPGHAQLRLTFDQRILRRHYVRRVYTHEKESAA